MPRIQLDNVAAHWNKLVENFQTSPREFYAAVEAALEQQRILGLRLSRVTWSESGILSPEREYLRITGGRYSFDICAAPFGTGFFFSSWLVKRPAQWVLVVFALYLGVAWLCFKGLTLFAGHLTAGHQGDLRIQAEINGLTPPEWHAPLALSIGFVLLGLLIGFVLIALLARSGWDEAEASMLAVPGFGWVYAVLFAPLTYYKLDTVAMFRAAADGAVKDTIDGLLTAKGRRALTEDERKPVFVKLL